MSVTITIASNIEYCTKNNLVTFEEYDCQHCSYYDATPECFECGGNASGHSGKVRFNIYPFEMNLANGNASTFLSALGIDFDYCGEMDARVIISALKSYDPALCVRSAVDEQNPNEARMINCGISFEHAESYSQRLFAIAIEAEKREEKIVWY